MIRLCLFDLDNTLLRTDDLERWRGGPNVGREDSAYIRGLTAAYNRRSSRDRFVYTRQRLARLRLRFPSIKWGVVTRSPRTYARTLLNLAYPGLAWDAVIAFEDVSRTKPYPDGVTRAMETAGVTDVREVALVGDDWIDVMTAYHSGCRVIIDQSTWPTPRAPKNYWAIRRVPDALIRDPEGLDSVLTDIRYHLPLLERSIEMDGDAKFRYDPQSHGFNPLNRVDKIGHYPPGTRKRGRKPEIQVHVLGRYFAKCEALKPRYAWHPLTAQIRKHKEAVSFPEEWMYAIAICIGRAARIGGQVVVTCIPKKPGGVPRMESLLGQVAKSKLINATYEVCPDLLAFGDGVVSAHKGHLDQAQRFENVNKHLYVARPDMVRGKVVVVLDDVVTSGATLIVARRKLLAAGAIRVECAALAQTITEYHE